MENPSNSPSRIAVTSWSFWSALVSLVLVVAVIAKVADLRALPIRSSDTMQDHVLVLVLCLLELAVACLILTSVLGRTTAIVGAVVFFAFFVISSSKVLRGETDCGCFGRFAVDPFWTCVFDGFASAIFLRFFSVCSLWPRVTAFSSFRFVSACCLFLIGGCALALEPANWGSVRSLYTSAQPNHRNIFGPADFVELSPAELQGTEFVLSNRIVESGLYSEGDWIFVIFKDSCSDCRELLFDIYKNGMRLPNAGMTCFVNVDHSSSIESELSNIGDRQTQELIKWVHLSQSSRWIGDFPMIACVRNGSVLKAYSSEEYFRAFSRKD
jgi:hypothetical protein